MEFLKLQKKNCYSRQNKKNFTVSFTVSFSFFLNKKGLYEEAYSLFFDMLENSPAINQMGDQTLFRLYTSQAHISAQKNDFKMSYLLYEKALNYRNLKYGIIQCPLCQNGFELLENMVKHANNVHDTRIYSKKIGRWIISDSDDTVKVEDCEMESFVTETPQITKFCYSCQDFQSNVGHETQWCPSR